MASDTHLPGCRHAWKSCCCHCVWARETSSCCNCFPIHRVLVSVETVESEITEDPKAAPLRPLKATPQSALQIQMKWCQGSILFWETAVSKSRQGKHVTEVWNPQRASISRRATENIAYKRKLLNCFYSFILLNLPPPRLPQNAL